MSTTDEKYTVTLNTLTNAAELAAGISLLVLNECFHSKEHETPTVDVVRQATLNRIKANHQLA